MNKQAPSVGRVLTMIAFAGSCIGLLIFLWISFGGATPFAGQGYLLNAEFNHATEMGTQADVRISGVSIGKVISVGLDRKTGLTRAVMRISSQFVPRPTDTRAILRAKTLLGETYIELTPGTRSSPTLSDGATIPRTQIAPSVQLDQILSTFDAKTRRAFQIWMQEGGRAITNRGESLNEALAQLYPFATNVDRVLSVLRRDTAATTALLRDTGTVFSALSAAPGQLQGFIRNSNATFAATAARDADLAATVRAFPAYLIQTRHTVNRLATFTHVAKPLIDEVRPAAVQLSPALEKLVPVAPELRDLFVNIGPLTRAARTGVPALIRFLHSAVPLLHRIRPYLGGLIPVINYINDFRGEVAGFFANSTANTQNTTISAAGVNRHNVRIANPVNPEVLAPYKRRPLSNRGNPYTDPGGYNALANGLKVFGGYLCTGNPLPTIGSSIPPATAKVLARVYFTSNPNGPTCRAQAPLGRVTVGQPKLFPHLTQLP
jgi:phospholipid/cholesterol/gamma-HCH transport system substrate-binding protein